MYVLLTNQPTNHGDGDGIGWPKMRLRYPSECPISLYTDSRAGLEMGVLLFGTIPFVFGSI